MRDSRRRNSIKPLITEVHLEDIIEEALIKLFEFRYNTVLDRVEFRKKGTDEFYKLGSYHERSILRMLKKLGIKCKKSSLVDILGSDFSPRFDPFLNYFKHLSKWNSETDYIRQLSNTISVEASDQEYLETILKKWLVSTVACAMGKNFNDGIFVLLGPQGIGKTRWIQKLLPEELKSYYYSGALNTRNKDIAIHLSETFLYCLDELEDMTTSKMGMFKANTCESNIRIRRPYGRVAENLTRRASLVATVNVPRFLKDATGSRRFLTIYTKEINYDHKIDIDKVFSQAYYLYQNGYQYWFSLNDIKEIEQHNEQFVERNELQDLILLHFEKADRSDATNYLASAEIAKYIAVHSQKDIKSIPIISLGKELNKLGFLTTKKNGIKLYMLKEQEQNRRS